MSEHDEQSALFSWASLAQSQYPELSLMFAIPNGAKLPYKKTPNGGRFCPQAIILLREGLRPGVPDILLPVARGAWHGLFIEMKFGKNKPSEEQVEFIRDVTTQGYQCAICWSWVDAKDQIENYLKGRL